MEHFTDLGFCFILSFLSFQGFCQMHKYLSVLSHVAPSSRARRSVQTLDLDGDKSRQFCTMTGSIKGESRAGPQAAQQRRRANGTQLMGAVGGGKTGGDGRKECGWREC